MTRTRRKSPIPYVGEQRLIGPMTCRVGLCGRDATRRVMCPGIVFDADADDGKRTVWTGIWYCREHADRCVTHGSPWAEV